MSETSETKINIPYGPLIGLCLFSVIILFLGFIYFQPSTLPWATRMVEGIFSKPIDKLALSSKWWFLSNAVIALIPIYISLFIGWVRDLEVKWYDFFTNGELYIYSCVLASTSILDVQKISESGESIVPYLVALSFVIFSGIIGYSINQFIQLSSISTDVVAKPVPRDASYSINLTIIALSVAYYTHVSSL